MKKNIFQKADLIRKVVKNTIGRDCTDQEILSILSRASNYDKGVVRTASDEVRIVLSKLQSKGVCPNTAYKYLKTSLMPAHIKEKAYNRRISTHKAILMASDEDFQRQVELENIIFEQGMKAIRGLIKCH